MRNVFAPAMPKSVSVGLLFVRICAGLAFVFHGYPKIVNPTAWMGSGPLTIPWSGATIAPLPDWLQALVAVVEFFGGLALIFGIFTRLAALAICVEMIVAFLFVELPRGTPFVAPGHTLEPNLMYMVTSFLLLLTGPGAASLDAVLFASRPETAMPQEVNRAA